MSAKYYTNNHENDNYDPQSIDSRGITSTAKLLDPGETGSIGLLGDLDGGKQQTHVEVEFDEDREKWGNKIDFMLSCVGYAVGLGNVWRFPYLCYNNGGASFLIPYFLMLLFNGIPLFYMELAVGQYLSLGTIGAWTALCPLARGVGFAMIMVSFLVSVYYNIIIAWVMMFLFQSFRAEVPWMDCGNDWNTNLCRTQRYVSVGNTTFNCTAYGLAPGCSIPEWKSPAEEFFNHRILNMSDSIDTIGSLGWEVTVSLLGSWVLVYLCLMKGVKSAGKVVYFTATFPYLVLVILFFRGVTLDGAGEGVLFYINPDWSKLADAKVWVRAATQIFYSLGIGFGSLLTFGSYNKFHNNCEKDSVIVCIINCSTSVFAGFVIFSVMGYMAFVLETTVDKVADNGPGLAFVAYPEAISQMPISTLWAILFFFMLITLGLDSQFAMVEVVVTSLSDEYPKYLRKYKWILLIATVVLMFLVALPMCAEGGMYIFNLFDFQTGGVSLLVIGFFEVLVVGWGLGTENLSKMIQSMTGKKPHRFFMICWKYLSPCFTLAIIIAQLSMWEGVTYNNKPYPHWAEAVGWFIAFSSMIQIPLFAGIQYYYCEGKTFKEKMKILLRPDPKAFRDVEIRENVQPLFVSVLRSDSDNSVEDGHL